MKAKFEGVYKKEKSHKEIHKERRCGINTKTQGGDIKETDSPCSVD